MSTVGFTGTRNGMTPEQRTAVKHHLARLCPGRVVHGDCIGADADFDSIAKELGIRCTIRPCTFDSMRAHCESLVVAEPKRPMARNRDIVADSVALIACPPNNTRIKSGSGTWATIRFGERAGIEVVVVFPDGSLMGGANERP